MIPGTYDPAGLGVRIHKFLQAACSQTVEAWIRSEMVLEARFGET